MCRGNRFSVTGCKRTLETAPPEIKYLGTLQRFRQALVFTKTIGIPS